MSGHSAKYRRYLASRAWRERKAYLVAMRGEKSCQRCGCTDQALDCHHIHYRTLEKESLEDVEFLCAGCHLKRDEERAERERRAVERRQQARRSERAAAFMTKRHGEEWWRTYSEDEAEDLYGDYLARRNREDW